MTNLGGARYLGRPSHRSSCAAPHLLRVPAYSPSHRRRTVGRTSRPLGSGADRDPRPQSEKGPCLEWESSVRRILRGSWRRAARPRRGAGGQPTNVGYTHRREKRYDSTAAAAADTGIRPATPQRMRHPPRRPPGAGYHHRDCDPPSRVRPAGLDFQLTMAAATRRLILLCDGGGLA